MNYNEDISTIRMMMMIIKMMRMVRMKILESKNISMMRIKTRMKIFHL